MSFLRNILKPSNLKSKTQFSVSSSTLYNSLFPSKYCTSASVTYHAGLQPTKPEEKPRVVVLGSGWAGCRLMKEIDTKIYDIVCVSPRNHMVFTPLLASTCVGTLEFRSVAEPIGRIQPAISSEPGSYYFLANCTSVDTKQHEVIFSINLGGNFGSWNLLIFGSWVYCLLRKYNVFCNQEYMLC